MSRLLPIALLLVAACDNGVAPDALVDAAPPDAAAPVCDTTQSTPSPTPAPPGMAQVTVAVGGRALADAVIVVHGADGAPRATAHTDTHGAATVAIDDGDAITAIDPSTARAWSVLGVASGDVLALGDGALASAAATDGTITVVLPPRPDGAIVHLRAQGGFDQVVNGATVTVPVPAGATGMWLLAVEEPIGDLPQMWSAIACAPVSGEVALPDLLGMDQMPVALRGIPDGATAAGVRLGDYRPLTGAPVDGAISGTAAFPIVVPGTVASWWASRDGGAIERGSAAVAADTASLELAPRWLPWVTGASANGRTISWTTDGAGAADAVLVELAGAGWTWQVLAPADSAPSLPVLPAELGFAGDPQVTDLALLGAPDGRYATLRGLPPGAPGVVTSSTR